LRKKHFRKHICDMQMHKMKDRSIGSFLRG
jgi:hypothetical protein